MREYSRLIKRTTIEISDSLKVLQVPAPSLPRSSLSLPPSPSLSLSLSPLILSHFELTSFLPITHSHAHTQGDMFNREAKEKLLFACREVMLSLVPLLEISDRYDVEKLIRQGEGRGGIGKSERNLRKWKEIEEWRWKRGVLALSSDGSPLSPSPLFFSSSFSPLSQSRAPRNPFRT